MAETRINLKHLLENLRDSYPFSLEEAILTELIANSLDSRASVIEITVSAEEGWFRVVDNGMGMERGDFRHYHDIASTTKTRGKGIGFAGVGAKLALLVCDEVITETRRKKVHLQSRWRLQKADRAQWNFSEPAGNVRSESGTAVTLHFGRVKSALLDVDGLRLFIQRHFRPLLDNLFQQVLQTVYRERLTLRLNGERVPLEGVAKATALETFVVRIPPRNKAIGVGFLSLTADPLPEDLQGLGISTYGKVIKRGWDWLTLSVQHPDHITGLVEIPDLASILTLNKADFMKTPSTVQKFYRYRNAVQRVVEPILANFGVAVDQKKHAIQSKPLERELESVLAQIIPEFPELQSLIGVASRGGIRVPVSVSTSTTRAEKTPRGEPASPPSDSLISEDASAPPARSRSGLQIGFDSDAARADLGWISGNTIWINLAHPAFVRNQRSNSHAFHIALTVALILSDHLLDNRSPQQFVSEFLSLWGKGPTGNPILPLLDQPPLTDKVN